MSGSRGVRIASDEGTLRRAAEATVTLGERHGLLIEEFIEGPEFSVEGIVHRGRTHILMITEKRPFPGDRFIESGHLQPARLSSSDSTHLQHAATQALAAVGTEMGHFHVEVFLTPHGPVVGEVHTRVGGDWIDLLTEEVLGIGMYGLAFDQLLGGTPDFSSLRPQCAAGVRFLQAASGTVTSLSGLREAALVEGVVRIDLRATPGMRVRAAESSHDRIGSFVVRGTSTEEVLQRLDAIESRIRVEIARLP